MLEGLQLLMNSSSENKKVDSEVAVLRLREWAERYHEAALRGPRFKHGDLVTPSKDCKIGGVGNPFLVIDTRIVARMDHQVSVCSCSQEDMRVISIHPTGDVVAGWVESALFESWTASEP